jgi:hypothetical protein
MDRSAAGWLSCCCVEGKGGVALYNYNVAEEFGGGRAVGGVVWIMQEVAGGLVIDKSCNLVVLVNCAVKNKFI